MHCGLQTPQLTVNDNSPSLADFCTYDLNSVCVLSTADNNAVFHDTQVCLELLHS